MSFQVITLEHVMLLSSLLFVIGMFGLFINRKNIIVLLMCLELMLLAVNINFVSIAQFYNDISGQIMTLFVFAIAAAEIAIGLAILTLFFRSKGSIDIDTADMMKG